MDAISRQGYIVEWRVLNAMNYGVPQNRERLFCRGTSWSLEVPGQHFA